jgi:hypothetical protein
MSDVVVYHPDPEINAGIQAEMLENERTDLAIGYPPRLWTCPCGATHSRGHFLDIGIHRCLSCGYVGPDGVMGDGTPRWSGRALQAGREDGSDG